MSTSADHPEITKAQQAVTKAQARQLGCKIYRISTEPYKFQDAVLVGAREGYYGECKFEIDLTTPDYVKLDRSVLKGLFGKFNPSRGDLVFSRNGELLGIMANSTYCMMLRSFDAGATFQLGQDVHQQHEHQRARDVALHPRYHKLRDAVFGEHDVQAERDRQREASVHLFRHRQSRPAPESEGRGLL